MSDTANDSNTGSNTGSNNAFTDREMQMLGWAMQSLKSGPPEIDYEKLAAYAGMSNPRSASNAWGKIKNKLASTYPTDGAVATPKKKGGRTKKAVSDDADGDNTTPRKRGAKNQDVDGEDTTPKKKPRTPAKAKKATADEEAADVKLEYNADGDDEVKADVAAEEEMSE